MEKNKENIILFVIVFFVSCLIFGHFLTMHYATDTYNLINVGMKNYAINWSLKDGRVWMFFITMISGYLNLNIKVYVIVLLLESLIISSFAVIKLKDILINIDNEKCGKWNRITILLISYCIIFNFMYLENLYFVEDFVMSISILFIVLAAECLLENNLKSFIKTFIYILVAVFAYQGTIGFFLALVTLLSILKNKKNFKQTIKDILKCCAIIILTILINIVFVKITEKFMGFNQNRVGNITNIYRNVIYIINNFRKIMIESVGLFPKYTQIIFAILIFILLEINCVLKKKDKSNILYLLFIVFITIASGFSTYLLSLTSFFTGRLRFSIGALIGIMFAYVFLKENIDKEKIYKNTMLVILFIYLLINTFQYVYIIRDSKRLNLFEKEEVVKIIRDIEKYENENDVNVKKIGVGIIKGNSFKTYNSNIMSKNILTYDALKCDWSVDGVINFYGNRKLKKYYVSNINDIVGNEEYKCVGNTLFIKVYNY